MAKNSFRSRFGPAACILGLLSLGALLHAQVRVYEFTTSHGMKIKIIQDAEMQFVQAQLLVFYDPVSKYLSSPVIPYFILYDMFEESWQRSSSKLSGHLQKMGDDFGFQQTSDYVRITVNFLPARDSTFGAFLKEFFTFSPFSLKKFKKIKNDFWSIFRKSKDWKKEAAFLVAYHHLFGEGFLGRTLITPEQIRTVNLAQINSFYAKNFRPDHALLVIRSSVNPYQMWGAIKNEMNLSLESKPFQRSVERVVPNTSRRIYLIPTDENEAPYIFFFDVAPSFDNPQFLSFFIIEYALFHYPFGRLYQSRSTSPLQIKNYPLSNEMVNHRDFSLVCSYVLVNAADLENMITLLDQEKRRLVLHQIRREEFGNALNYLLGKTRIDSTRVETEVEVEIGKTIAENKPVYVAPSTDMFQRVSFEGLAQVVDEYFAFSQRSGPREKGVVVIIGNEEQILSQWKGTRPEIVYLFD